MATTPTRPTDPAALNAARATVASLMAGHHVPGLSVAVTDADRLLFAEGFGAADLATARPATPDTRYLWFSMSKIATATVAVRLADEGRLDLDAPVRDLVPGYAARSGEQPRVRQLLDHTAGAANPLPVRWVLPAAAGDADVSAATRRVLDRHGHPKRSAGGPARYSNLGYLVLAEVVSHAAGEPFEQHVERSLLQPAGMTATGYRHRDGADHATGYVRLPRPATPLLRAALPAGTVGDRHGAQVALRPFRVAGAGYGGLIGPVPDAARLLRLHLADGVVDGRRLLAPETARAMRTIATPGRPFDLGLGWFRRPADRSARPEFVEHWGTGGGFWNAMRLYPGLGLGVVVMANTTRAYDHSALMSALLPAFT
ncbi:CubicO group peptidase, beta-lactamase class C family [Geodermatophilus telluris]|uniref:CubicO group peptidase, beta-lactamase class C family n=1 Tax=Geodermatophilus telluris TaxID=1190417 RepID=A0A1G6MD91_9ACTN|nr:serine hydrolase domain-containing protein [Geodermatophilus telluris]SDC52915.1 CubicO group peptidase, beta-lactamase class C family [Geodermatophilus telluris]